MSRVVKMPERGMPREEVLSRLRECKREDARWREGRTWSLVYFAGDEVAELLKEAYGVFMHENALSPLAFPSLRKLETEVVSMTASLLGGDAAVAGSMTTGGTESILMAVKTARDKARAERPDVVSPEILLPTTGHPAFKKAAQYFGLKVVTFPVGPDLRADVDAARAAVTSNTIMLVGSAPCYPYGVIDPISDLASLALERGIWFHVDACLGGFMLPFLRKLGYPVPPFDFSVPGVTSISADVHKYGYALKGASVVLYRDRKLRRYQFEVVTDWPGGIYASPTMPGTRPGGTIAAAWAVMNYMGEEGYLSLAARVMETTRRIRAGIEAIEGLRVMGNPDMSVLAFTSDQVNVYAVADAMGKRGWSLDPLQLPPALHLMVTPAHEPVVEDFLGDLQDSVREAAAGDEAVMGTTAAIYGMLAAIPSREMGDAAVLNLLDELYTLGV